MDTINYSILINVVTTLLGILITAFITYFFSQRRYTFEKMFDRKLVYLEEIYGRVISLEKDLKKYILTTGSMMDKDLIAQKKEQISPIQTKFFELQEYFWKKEIALDKSSVASIKSFIETSIQVLGKLQTLIISSNINDYDTAYSKWEEAYNTMDEKLENAKQELKKDFRKVSENK